MLIKLRYRKKAFYASINCYLSITVIAFLHFFILLCHPLSCLSPHPHYPSASCSLARAASGRVWLHRCGVHAISTDKWHGWSLARCIHWRVQSHWTVFFHWSAAARSSPKPWLSQLNLDTWPHRLMKAVRSGIAVNHDLSQSLKIKSKKRTESQARDKYSMHV